MQTGKLGYCMLLLLIDPDTYSQLSKNYSKYLMIKFYTEESNILYSRRRVSLFQAFGSESGSSEKSGELNNKPLPFFIQALSSP